VQPLKKKVAVVAGATRGAGRGIACMLGEAGAVVYCSGRTARGRPARDGPYAGRPETIEETAEMVRGRGGTGIAVRTDHRVEEQVAALFDRVRREQGRLDILVNVFWGGPSVMQWGEFWKHSLQGGHELFAATWPHVMTCHHAVPLMIERRGGLIVQVTEGDGLFYRMNLFYDLGRLSELRLAYALAEELAPRRLTALGLTPGFMRTEAMLEHFGVTEANWRDGNKKDAHWQESETPFFVGRAVVALASDPQVFKKSGGVYSSWGLAREYGFTDVDGSRPDVGKTFDAFPFGPPRTGLVWTLSRVSQAKDTGRRRGAAATKRKTQSTGRTRRGANRN
jgi:NAD(P)-dependent dehydrogenase (short-subunit alcohol dehydrogenase family)